MEPRGQVVPVHTLQSVRRAGMSWPQVATHRHERNAEDNDPMQEVQVTKQRLQCVRAPIRLCTNTSVPDGEHAGKVLEWRAPEADASAVPESPASPSPTSPGPARSVAESDGFLRVFLGCWASLCQHHRWRTCKQTKNTTAVGCPKPKRGIVWTPNRNGPGKHKRVGHAHGAFWVRTFDGTLCVLKVLFCVRTKETNPQADHLIYSLPTRPSNSSSPWAGLGGGGASACRTAINKVVYCLNPPP